MSKEKDNYDRLTDEIIDDISKEDLDILNNWSETSENRSKFHQLINELQLPEHIQEFGSNHKKVVWKKVNKLIERSKYRRTLVKITAVAAIFLLIIGFSNYLSYQYGYQQVASQMVEMSNPLGMKSSITLPDGTKVFLNAGTTISYPTAFLHKYREIQLTGEAFFEVQHNPDHPFIVNIDNLKVEVMGTEFNVKAYENDDRIEVSLLEGKVGVKHNMKSGMLKLNPGEQALYDRNSHTLAVKEVNVNHYISWKSNKYYFDKLPLDEIAKQLERIFNVTIHISSPDLKKIVLTGDFIRGENIEQILRVMTADKRMKYTIDGDIITIDKK